MRLIDADNLIEHSWDADTRCGYVQVVDAGTIEEAPTIDPVRHGKWAYRGEEKGYFCSVCGSGCLLNRESDWHKSDFCPHCGAKMYSNN